MIAKTSNGELYYISQLLKQCFATHISVLLLNVVDLYYMLCKIIKNFITAMIDGDDFFQ